MAYDDAFIPRNDSAALGLAQRRSGGARTIDASGVWGTAPDGPSLHAARKTRSHSANFGSGQRGLPTSDRLPAGRLAEPRPFLRDRGADDAPDSDRPRPESCPGQARRRPASGIV